MKILQVTLSGYSEDKSIHVKINPEAVTNEVIKVIINKLNGVDYCDTWDVMLAMSPTDGYYFDKNVGRVIQIKLTWINYIDMTYLNDGTISAIGFNMDFTKSGIDDLDRSDYELITHFNLGTLYSQTSNATKYVKGVSGCTLPEAMKYLSHLLGIMESYVVQGIDFHTILNIKFSAK